MYRRATRAKKIKPKPKKRPKRVIPKMKAKSKKKKRPTPKNGPDYKALFEQDPGYVRGSKGYNIEKFAQSAKSRRKKTNNGLNDIFAKTGRLVETGKSGYENTMKLGSILYDFANLKFDRSNDLLEIGMKLLDFMS
jgi:hypothetical protein